MIPFPGSPGLPMTAVDKEKAKFVPIHCIVEQTASPSGGKHLVASTEANVELDTYAILPSSALFSDIVRIALLKIGYSSSEAMGAKGTIQIRNWKPLTFDTITENPDVTIEEILGDLTSLSTLRLRLCSQSKRCAMEDIKEKLLQFLLQRSQGILSSSGCPIEKTLLSQMSKG
ncbi:hypothetical protein LSAT2_029218 [Lamellibrachia satsuma]|nr:hypothetical protein LSAT2_029218 [Lamellibrachia satsuma]